MKNFKWLILMLIAVFALSLFTACGGFGGSSDTENGGSSSIEQPDDSSGGNSGGTSGNTSGGTSGGTSGNTSGGTSGGNENVDGPSIDAGFTVTLIHEGKEYAVPGIRTTLVTYVLNKAAKVNINDYYTSIDGVYVGPFYQITEDCTITTTPIDEVNTMEVTVSVEVPDGDSTPNKVEIPANSSADMCAAQIMSTMASFLYKNCFDITVNGNSADYDTVLKEGDNIVYTLKPHAFTFTVEIDGSKQELYGYDSGFNMDMIMYLLGYLNIKDMLNNYYITIDKEPYNGEELYITESCNIVITGKNQGGNTEKTFVCEKCGNEFTFDYRCNECGLCENCCKGHTSSGGNTDIPTDDGVIWVTAIVIPYYDKDTEPDQNANVGSYLFDAESGVKSITFYELVSYRGYNDYFVQTYRARYDIRDKDGNYVDDDYVFTEDTTIYFYENDPDFHITFNETYSNGETETRIVDAWGEFTLELYLFSRDLYKDPNPSDKEQVRAHIIERDQYFARVLYSLTKNGTPISRSTVLNKDITLYVRYNSPLFELEITVPDKADCEYTQIDHFLIFGGTYNEDFYTEINLDDLLFYLEYRDQLYVNSIKDFFTFILDGQTITDYYYDLDKYILGDKSKHTLVLEWKKPDFFFTVTIEDEDSEYHGNTYGPFEVKAEEYLVDEGLAGYVRINEVLEKNLPEEWWIFMGYRFFVDGVKTESVDHSCNVIAKTVPIYECEGCGLYSEAEQLFCPDCKLCNDCCWCDNENTSQQFNCVGCNKTLHVNLKCQVDGCALCINCCKGHDGVDTTRYCPACGYKLQPIATSIFHADYYCYNCNDIFALRDGDWLEYCEECNGFTCEECDKHYLSKGELCTTCGLCIYGCCKCNTPKYICANCNKEYYSASDMCNNCNYCIYCCDGHDTCPTCNYTLKKYPVDGCGYAEHYFCEYCAAMGNSYYYCKDSNGVIIHCPDCNKTEETTTPVCPDCENSLWNVPVEGCAYSAHYYCINCMRYYTVNIDAFICDNCNAPCNGCGELYGKNTASVTNFCDECGLCIPCCDGHGSDNCQHEALALFTPNCETNAGDLHLICMRCRTVFYVTSTTEECIYCYKENAVFFIVNIATAEGTAPAGIVTEGITFDQFALYYLGATDFETFSMLFTAYVDDIEIDGGFTFCLNTTITLVPNKSFGDAYYCDNCGNTYESMYNFCENCTLCVNCCTCTVSSTFECPNGHGDLTERTPNECPTVYVHYYCHDCNEYYVYTDSGLNPCPECSDDNGGENVTLYPCGQCTFEPTYTAQELCWNCKLCFKCCPCNNDENEMTRFTISVAHVEAAGIEDEFCYTTTVTLEAIGKRIHGDNWAYYNYYIGGELVDQWIVLDTNTTVLYILASEDEDGNESEDNIVTPSIEICVGYFSAVKAADGKIYEEAGDVTVNTRYTVEEFAREHMGIMLEIDNYTVYLDGIEITDYSTKITHWSFVSIFGEGVLKAHDESFLSYELKIKGTDPFGMNIETTEWINEPLTLLGNININGSSFYADENYEIYLDGKELPVDSKLAFYYPIYKACSLEVYFIFKADISADDVNPQIYTTTNRYDFTVNAIANQLGVDVNEYVWQAGGQKIEEYNYDYPIDYTVGSVYGMRKTIWVEFFVYNEDGYTLDLQSVYLYGEEVALSEFINEVGLRFEDYMDWSLQTYMGLETIKTFTSASDVLTFTLEFYESEYATRHYILYAYPVSYNAFLYNSETGETTIVKVNGKTTVEEILNQAGIDTYNASYTATYKDGWMVEYGAEINRSVEITYTVFEY